jgi:hypothetical protein
MTSAPATTAALNSLERRVRGEYLEMPGQRLTIEQASRLWGVDERIGAEVLNHLVDAGFLSHVAPYYFRADLGRLSV